MRRSRKRHTSKGGLPGTRVGRTVVNNAPNVRCASPTTVLGVGACIALQRSLPSSEAGLRVESSVRPPGDCGWSTCKHGDSLEMDKLTPIISQLARTPMWQSVNAQFFGAHTYQIKISRDWTSLLEDQIPILRDELLRWAIQFASGPNVVMTKLCVALTAYALRAVPEYWQNFIPSFYEECNAARQAGKDVGAVLLEFFTVVPEEVGRADLVGGSKARFHQELLDAVPTVLGTLEMYIMSGPSETSAKALRCLQSWVQYGIKFEQVQPFLNAVINLLHSAVTFNSAMELLIEIIGQPSSTAYQDTLFDGLIACSTGEFMTAEFQRSFEEPDEETARIIARFLSSIGETYVTQVTRKLTQVPVMRYLEMMVALTRYPGYYGVEQEVSDIPLHFWTFLQETLVDPDVLPPRPPPPSASEDDLRICYSTDDLATATAAAIHKPSVEEAAAIRDAAKPVFSGLVHALRKASEYPPKSDWFSWTKDAQDKFKVYRRDVGDTLINAYYVVREDMLEQLVGFASAQLACVTPGEDHWQPVEATLFSLRSVSEAVPPMESRHISRIFSAEIFGVLTQWEGNPKLKHSALLFIGSYAEWLKFHPQYLEAALYYLVPCLANPELAFSAATALKNVCDVCREELVDAIAGLVNMYVTYNSNMQPREKQKVVESISDVIQALPAANMLEPLAALVGDCHNSLLCVLGKNTSAAKSEVINQLQYLTACCRGIQFPGDDETSTHVSLKDEDVTKAQQEELRKICWSAEAVAMRSAVWDDVVKITDIWLSDFEVMEAVTNYIDTSLRTEIHLLMVPLSELANYLIPTFTKASYHTSLIDTAAQAVTTYGDNQQATSLLTDVLLGISQVVLAISNANDMDNQPDIISSYFSLITRYIRKCPAALYHVPPEALDRIIACAITALRVKERLALKSAVFFIVEFVGCDCQLPELARLFEEKLGITGPQITHELLAGIGGMHPRSYVVHLADALFRLVSKRIEAAKMWLALCLEQEGFPSPHVDLQAKREFSKQLLKARSLKTFKGVVQEFSLKCRKLENTTYGAATVI